MLLALYAKQYYSTAVDPNVTGQGFVVGLMSGFIYQWWMFCLANLFK